MALKSNNIISTTTRKIGSYTKYQREKRRYSLNEFAKKIQVTTSFLLRLERGEYKSVQFDMIEKIAAGFEMTIEDFLQKCGIVSTSEELPSLDYYLKEMYQFPEEAIEDIKLFIDFLKEKYAKDIVTLKKVHEAYWNNKK